jgi:type II secretory pathway pseudopilin PulG
MGIKYNPGFTIIETMLFLSITGVLVVALLAGAGASINTQRYHDAVTSFQSLLQDQYSQVTNVVNIPATNAVTCDSNAVITNDSSSPAGPRGQGDCVVMGKYVTIVDTAVTSTTVVGRSVADSSTYSNDISELQAYKLALLSNDTSASDVEWGARIAWPSGGTSSRSPTTPRTFTFLVIRSPKSGTTYTFSSDSTSTSLHDMIIPGIAIPGQSQRRICLDSNGLQAGSGGLAVFVEAYASGPSAIEIRTNDMGDDSVC